MSGINKIKVINEIIRILMASKEYLSVKEITRKLSEQLEEDINQRNVKEYIKDIREILEYPLESRKGVDGGVKFSNQARELIATISHVSLSHDEKNALNDAFEIAEKSISFYYYHDLQIAREKLYLRFDLKDQDYEYYIGHNQSNRREATKTLKEIKQAIIGQKKVEMSFKYGSYGISKELNIYKPLFVVHDSDESWVIIRDSKGIDHCQNILNIKEYNITSKPFVIENKPSITKFVNSHTIRAKGEHILSFEIIDELGHEMYDTWNYEFEELESSGDKKKIIFYERYRVYEFLLRMQPHISNLKCDDVIKKQWNSIVSNLRKID